MNGSAKPCAKLVPLSPVKERIPELQRGRFETGSPYDYLADAIHLRWHCI